MAVSHTPTATLVSVVIPVFNGATFLGAALDSVFAQTYALLDVIVVDDRSTDATCEVAARHQDRLTLVRQANAGPASARNAGITLAKGELIAFLDADDLWVPEKLRTQVAYLSAHQDCLCVAARFRQIVEPDAEEYVRNRKDWLTDSQASRFLGTLLVRKSVFDVVGLLYPQFRVGEDVDWSRLDDKGIACDAIDEVLVIRRVHRNNMTNQTTAASADTLRAIHRHIQRRRARDADQS